MAEKIRVGSRLFSKHGGWFEVMEILSGADEVSKWNGSEKILVKFDETRGERVTSAGTAANGGLKDLHKAAIMGVGFMGDGKYKSRKPPSEGMKKYKSYACWENMLWRVYGDHRLSNRYKGLGVKVCDEWHNFQVFCEWYLEHNKGEGFTLEKDILSHGNKVYCPEYCRFVPQELNKFFTAMNKCRGKYPVGVHFSRGKFIASLNYKGKDETRLSYDTPEEAFQCYKERKEFALKGLADKLFSEGKIEEDIYEACYKWQVEPFPE